MVHVVKIYFEDTKHEKQIRRLVVSSDVISNFKLLLEKIQNIFGFETNNVLMKWKDPENDFIHMSTDDELAQALANAEDGLLRLYVFLKEDISKNENDKTNASKAASDEVLHPHVVCDGCDKNIFGIRYKCLECRDFDLCTSCNLRNEHSFHDMIKLVKPTHVPREWVFTGARRLWKSMFNRCPGTYFQYLMNEINGKSQNKEAQQCSSNNDCSADKQDPSTSKDTMGTGSANTSSNYQSGSDSKEKNSKDVPRHIRVLDPSNWPDIIVECLNGDLDETRKTIGVLLEHFKNTQVKVDCPFFKSEFKVATPEQEKQKPEPAKEKAENKAQQEEVKIKKQAEEKTRQEEAKAEEVTKTTESVSPSIQVPNPFLKKGIQSSETYRAKSSEAYIPQLSTDAAKIMDTVDKLRNMWNGMGEPKLSKANEVTETVPSAEEWTFLNNDETSKVECGVQATNTDNLTSEKVVEYPDVMEVDSEMNLNNTETKDPVILTALKAMEAMGFTNEGGWLEKLLISKHGNINEALDALYPGARNQ